MFSFTKTPETELTEALNPHAQVEEITDRRIATTAKTTV